ncbi:hypothetical protein [Liquorilactobacillus hordei]|uniref:hypothetical protein n=1 Tax=Liquorilactobacillus hordei TaxID=468911 RepID=UPI0039E7BE14
MLTTVDNPYDPNQDYDKWMNWDHDHEYYTAEYLARLAQVPDDADDATVNAIIDQAQQEIMNADTLGIYKIV